uniref:Uncharacterized protein n=1 Tax=Anguilla anguilla TaxID=7936 RepID=A0A0E9UZ87_ANGAN
MPWSGKKTCQNNYFFYKLTPRFFCFETKSCRVSKLFT